MIVKVSDYNALRPELVGVMKKKGKDCISELSAIYSVPVIVMYLIYGQEFGFDEHIYERINDLKIFYSYTKVEE